MSDATPKTSLALSVDDSGEAAVVLDGTRLPLTVGVEDVLVERFGPELSKIRATFYVNGEVTVERTFIDLAARAGADVRLTDTASG